MLLPILNTSRLILRPFQEKDAFDFYQMNLDKEVMRYTGDLPFPTIEAAKDFIRTYDQYRRFGMGRLTVEHKITGEYLGWCGLKYHENSHETDLGFRLKKNAWRKGYATEAGKACLKWAFEDLELKQIIARVHIENNPSLQLLKKLGFEWTEDFMEDGKRWSKFLLSKS